MTDDLRNVKYGDQLLINKNGEFYAIADVVESTANQVVTRQFGKFSAKHGSGLPLNRSPYKAFLPTEIELVSFKEIKKKMEEEEVRRAEEEDKKEEERKKAEYDALPEEIKLARKLQFFCDVNKHTTVAKMPIETLRAAVKWIEENKLECE